MGYREAVEQFGNDDFYLEEQGLLQLEPPAQVIPLHRVILAIGFCTQSLQLKPLCGWSPNTRNFRFAMSRNEDCCSRVPPPEESFTRYKLERRQ